MLLAPSGFPGYPSLMLALLLVPLAVSDELAHWETRSQPTEARLFVQDVLTGARDLDAACAWLDDLAACNKLRALKGKPPAELASVRQAQGVDWAAAGSRMAFDKDAAVLAAPAAVDSTPLPAASPDKTTEDRKGDEKGLRIVSISVEALQKLAKKQTYKERKVGLDHAYGLTEGVKLSGAGFFSAKLLSPEEVRADETKRRLRAEAEARGEKLTFLRTNTKAQLFGEGSRNVPVGGLPVGFGLRLGGVVEIVETRAIPRDGDVELEKLRGRVFRWPLSVERLKKDLRVGEDVTITGRLDRGAGAGVGLGQRLGDWVFGSVGAGVTAGSGKAEDDWVSLRISKLDEDHVRVLLQKGNGETLSLNVAAQAGLDLYDDSFIPANEPPSRLEDGVVGKAVLKGEKSLLKKVEQLASAELSAGWSKGRHEVQSEGWSSLSLSDEAQAKALDRLFDFKPDALRALGPTLTAEARDVTRDSRLQARLSALKITKTAGAAFYEVRWKDGSGPVKSYLVGVARSSFRGEVTDTRRDEESVMWYDLETGRPAVTVSLGPQERLLTTTREKINDVIAAQKALGLRVNGEIDHPSPYLQLFGLGNYGRTVERGQFSLTPEGAAAVKGASRDELISAYLRADWLFERESFPPGYIWAAHSKPPPWAEGGDPARALEFLRLHGSEALRLRHDRDESGQLRWLEREYEEAAPGRSLTADADDYASAAAYANRVQDMQRSGEPERLIELFLALRRDRQVDLKRSVAATAYLSRHNFAAHIEMTGKRVNLKPEEASLTLPKHPLTRLNEALAPYR